MAYANAVLIGNNNEKIFAPLGFSWTVALFGFIVPIFRRDYFLAAVMFLLSIVTLGISTLIFSCIYNNLYLKKLLKMGYEISDIADTDKKIHIVGERNPVSYNDVYKKYYVWVDMFNVKYMKYFKTKTEAIEFMKTQPNRCLRIKYLTRSLNSHTSKMRKIIERYKLPYEHWGDNIPAK